DDAGVVGGVVGGPRGGWVEGELFVGRGLHVRLRGGAPHSLRAASSTRAADDDYGVARGVCLTPVTRINREDQRDKLADVPVRPVTAGTGESGRRRAPAPRAFPSRPRRGRGGPSHPPFEWATPR